MNPFQVSRPRDRLYFQVSKFDMSILENKSKRLHNLNYGFRFNIHITSKTRVLTLTFPST